MTGRPRRVLAILLAALLVAALTAIVFLIRAGDPGVTNWPIQWELRSSDNGVLFQFAQDLFAGRDLDWSFSPQVYVFPEIPISVVAYLLSGGTVQLYYLVVAAINNALLFLGLFAVIRYLFPGERLGTRLARAAIATVPLLLLPLLGTTVLFSYALAPSYYFGMYLLIVAAPTLFLARRRWVRVVVGVGIALAGASNPLAFVFTVPAFACVLGVRAWGSVRGSGWRSIRGPGLVALAVLVLALGIRLLFFGRLEGTSPLSYIDPSIFSGRIGVVGGYLRALAGNPVTATLLGLGALLALVGIGIAIVLARRYLRRSHEGVRDAAALTAIYFALAPLTGLVGTAVLLITDYLYLWPVLVAPLVFGLLPLPKSWIPVALPAGAGLLVVAAVLTGAIPNLAAAPAYFGYRSAETRCLDARLPAGITVGYSTFSDARRLSLTSVRPFRLIQLKSSAVRAYWLTNRDYARDDVGRFFYLNDHGDEPAIDRGYLVSHFGEPDRRFDCAPGQTVWIYDAPTKLAAIEARYSTLPAP